MPNIHNTSIVDPKAKIPKSAKIGPFCIIGPDVDIGENVSLISNVSITGRTIIGDNTKIFPFAVLGQDPQHANYKGEPTSLIIGKNNIIRESVTMHPGTKDGNMKTIIGDDCFFMAGSHVAHDCHVFNNVILTNSVALGGHVTVEEFAIIGGLSGIHQYVRIGKHSMVGGCSGVDNDVIPYGSVKGNRARLTGLNIIGLRRRGFDATTIKSIQNIYRILFQKKHNNTQAISIIEAEVEATKERDEILSFIQNSQRGIMKGYFQN